MLLVKTCPIVLIVLAVGISHLFFPSFLLMSVGKECNISELT